VTAKPVIAVAADFLRGAVVKHWEGRTFSEAIGELAARKAATRG
jgi:hypothetical protein